MATLFDNLDETQLQRLEFYIMDSLSFFGQDCYYDHHGYCQAHWLSEDCPVSDAMKIVEEHQKE